MSHVEEPPRAFVAEDFQATAPDSDASAHGAMRKAAWVMGASLVTLGALGISSDRILWMYDSTAITIGLLALPPMTDFVRRNVRQFPRSGFAHGALALFALGGAFALNVSGVVSGPATFPSLQHVRDTGFGEVNLTDPVVIEQRALQAKTEYMVKVETALEAMTREAKLMADVDAMPTSYDVQVLNDRAALVSLRRAMTLSAEENALVDTLAAKVAADRAAMAPGLRRAYVEELNGPLANYGVSARMIGDNIIEFIGAALADPQRQQSILSLTEKERMRLGFAGVRFVAAAIADAGGPSIVDVSEPADAPADGALGPAAALSPALAPDGAEQNPPA